VDTSTIINLNATGCAETILRHLPARLSVVDIVVEELENGRPTGRHDADMLHQLVTKGGIKVVNLNDQGMRFFEQLVVGPAASTLDDGEAATIAYAATNCVPIVIDEKKATRICSDIFPHIQVSHTVTILAHEAIRRNIGTQALCEAVFNALQRGRMNVAQDHLQWVIELIGLERAATCLSLPKSVRTL
jgi:predicted nucleic acid-binding protein